MKDQPVVLKRGGGGSVEVKASWPEPPGSASSCFCTALKEHMERPPDHPLGPGKKMYFAKLIPMSFPIIFWRGKESYSFLHCSVQCSGKNDGVEAVESPVSKSYSLQWRFAGVFFLTQKNLLCGCFKIIFFLSQLTFVHTSSELAAPIPSSHWKIERFSCYYSWVFSSVLLKALQEITVQLYFHCLSSGGCPVNPGIVLLAKDSNTSQRRQSLLQLT